MCGIAGIAGPADPRIVAAMTRALAHRGPDGTGVVCPEGEGFGLGHRRLAIIDRSPAGAQPMADPSGRYWITYNGEIYNFRGLRAELEKRGRSFRSGTDTEVLLAAYEAWGAGCLDRLNGMFAFAIWDRATRSLFAVRDRLGVKPLYYAATPDRLIFASEVKAILASNLIVAEADPEVTHNPWHYPSAPRTGFLGIWKLPAGHTLAWKEGHATVRRWWSIHPETRRSGSESGTEELRTLLQEAVSLNMVSDVPIGAMLSGGLDSSTIVSLMQRHSPVPVHTFSIRFRPADMHLEAGREDGHHARLVARSLGCHHREIEVSPDIVSLLPKLVWHLDEPIFDPAAINAYLIAQAARQEGVLVLLNGMGADEIFGGYRKHLACLLADRYQAVLPGMLRRGLETMVEQIPVAGTRRGFRGARWAKRFFQIASLPPIDRFLLSDQSLSPADYRRLYADAAEFPYDRLAEVRTRRELMSRDGISYLARMCLVDTTVFLPDHNLTYTDKATMAAGVEGRPPLIDHRIVELAFGLSDRERIRGRIQKALFREAASPWLPRSVVARPKSPFSAPLRAWVRRDLREMVDDLLSVASVRSRGLYRPEGVRALIEEDRQGWADHSQLVWGLLSREVWARSFFDGSRLAMPSRDVYRLRSALVEADALADSSPVRVPNPSAL